MVFWKQVPDIASPMSFCCSMITHDNSENKVF
uniref:Uncharacterized protein n=1 Tax=Rhizophora mucronata TaxID=61149 RepID=A0A2P2N1P3_RHIMU